MRLVYFDDGAELTTKYGGTVCAEDGKAHTYSVDLNPYGSNRTDLVKVSLQKQTATSGWTTVESSYFDADFTTDKIKLTADGIDLGDDWWGVGGPLGSATVSWTPGEDGAITPRVNGSLYLNNMAGVCARMKIYYWSADDDLLATKYGGQVCSPDNGLPLVDRRPRALHIDPDRRRLRGDGDRRHERVVEPGRQRGAHRVRRRVPRRERLDVRFSSRRSRAASPRRRARAGRAAPRSRAPRRRGTPARRPRAAAGARARAGTARRRRPPRRGGRRARCSRRTICGESPP